MAKYIQEIIKKFILIYFAIIFFSSSCLAQTYEPEFQEISTVQGLSQSTVTCILQDSRGYLWFGTKDGLNRYDGYGFEIFRNDPKNNSSISDNTITALAEDKYGDIWIGTVNGFLNKYDYAAQKFFSYKIKTHPVFLYRKNLIPEIPSCFAYYDENTITSLCCDKDGNVWIGTWGKGLLKFDAETE